MTVIAFVPSLFAEEVVVPSTQAPVAEVPIASSSPTNVAQAEGDALGRVDVEISPYYEALQVPKWNHEDTALYLPDPTSDSFTSAGPNQAQSSLVTGRGGRRVPFWDDGRPGFGPPQGTRTLYDDGYRDDYANGDIVIIMFPRLAPNRQDARAHNDALKGYYQTRLAAVLAEMENIRRDGRLVDLSLRWREWQLREGIAMLDWQSDRGVIAGTIQTGRRVRQQNGTYRDQMNPVEPHGSAPGSHTGATEAERRIYGEWQEWVRSRTPPR